MFTSSEIKNIMSMGKSCNNMSNLLKNLGYVVDTQCSYSEIDSFITDKVCRLMKSKSIPEGYSFLLRAGGIPLDFSGTPNERLAKVVANRRIIEPAIIIQRNISSSPQSQYETRFIVSSLRSRSINTGKKTLIEEFNSFIKKYTREDVCSNLKPWGPGPQISQQSIIKLSSFKAYVQQLKESMEQLPDTIDTYELDMSLSHQYRESELIEFLKSQNENDSFVVSKRLVKCNAPQPDLNRKFTSEEAARMFDILEQINALVSNV